MKIKEYQHEKLSRALLSVSYNLQKFNEIHEIPSGHLKRLEEGLRASLKALDAIKEIMEDNYNLQLSKKPSKLEIIKILESMFETNPDLVKIFDKFISLHLGDEKNIAQTFTEVLESKIDYLEELKWNDEKKKQDDS